MARARRAPAAGESLPSARRVRTIRAALLAWYAAHRRDLPWRRTSDPYAIWVSEIMLQQTQVETVRPYYERFVRRFPSVVGLARAPVERVLGLWSGLGYYRRARMLHAGAREVVKRHGGRLPVDAAALRQLPGIGRYTAGAIASIAFGLAEPILDGNVRRVLSRVFAIEHQPPVETRGERRLWALAGLLVEGPAPGDLNQGLMELGALVCSPRDPDCRACPLSRSCHARASGNPERWPAPQARPSTERVRVAVALVRRSGRVLVERPGADSPLRGTWDLPALELNAGATAEGRIRTALARRHAIEVRPQELLARASHGIMQRRLQLEIYECRLSRGRVAGSPSLRWLDPVELTEAAVSGATHKVLRAAG